MKSLNGLVLRSRITLCMPVVMLVFFCTSVHTVLAHPRVGAELKVALPECKKKTFPTRKSFAATPASKVQPRSVSFSSIVAQYFGIFDPNWTERFRQDTPLTALNRLYISFGKLVQQADGSFTLGIDGDPARVVELISRMQTDNPQAELFLTVGGDGGLNSYGGAAADPNFPKQVRLFLQSYGFNGFDIDWEEDLSETPLNQLVTALYTELHLNDTKLTLDVWPNVLPAYNMAVLRSNLDQINLMSYGSELDLGTVVSAFAQAGFPVNQMIGGVETEWTYGDVDTLGPQGTIVAKANYALMNGLAGMMGWRLDNDYADDPAQPNVPTYQGAIQLAEAMGLWGPLSSIGKTSPNSSECCGISCCAPIFEYTKKAIHALSSCFGCCNDSNEVPE